MWQSSGIHGELYEQVRQAGPNGIDVIRTATFWSYFLIFVAGVVIGFALGRKDDAENVKATRE
jgi:hypothetical protein